ncbi:hypothetical protein BCR36DRAFT_580093, partial [Piromyces finnis]
MKNIRDYTPKKYIEGKEYTLVEPHIYKTLEKKSLNSISLKGISDEALSKTLRDLKDWTLGTGREESFYVIEYNGKRYYREIEDEDENQIEKDYTIYIEEDLKELYVTSIMYEPEPEFEENEPSEAFITQYPLEDILDEFSVYCYDDYSEENKNDNQHSYIEFASPEIQDIRNVRTIIGKHVYNVTENDIVRLKI